MASIIEATVQQSTSEIRGWIVDFTDDLPIGGTITGGTATHIPPSGAASVPVVAAASPKVTATIGPLSVTGQHYLDIQATVSNGEKLEERIAFTVNYPTTTARAGMLPLIRKLRRLTNAGPVDYLVAGEPYWTDAQLQEVLDVHRTDVIHEELRPIVEYTGGVPFTKRHFSSWENYESGTAYFFLEDAAGSVAGTALYTPDYERGEFVFASDTGGAVYYLTGRSFDLHGAAAEVWEAKAEHFAEVYDFSTDGHSMKRSQLIQHCEQRAKHHRQLKRGATGTVSMERDDINACTY